MLSGARALLQKENLPIALAAFAVLLVHSLYCYSVSDSRGVLVFSLVVSALFLSLYIGVSVWRSRREVRIEALFLIAVLCLGILYSAVFAPSTVPDEVYHYQSSYYLSDLLLFSNPTVDSMPVRADDAHLIDFFLERGCLLTPDQYVGIFSSPLVVQDPSLVYIDPVSDFDFGSNPPQVKIASALGISLARLLHFGSYPTFYTGRLFNFMFFVALVYLAIRITPVGKRAMIAVALLPMTLHVASSYSYDAGIIGFGFLLTGLCLRAIYGEGAISKRLCVSIALVAVLLAPCKMVYAILMLMVLAVPSRRFSSRKNSYVFKGATIVLAIASVVVLRLPSLLQIVGFGSEAVGESVVNVRGTETGTFYSLFSVLSDPIDTILIFLRTFDSMGDMYIGTAIGRSLGWFQGDLLAPWYVAIAFLFVLVLSCVRWSKDCIQVSKRNRIFFATLVVVGWLAIMLSMLTGWTFDSEVVIQGVQGRYLLPLLPLFLVAFQSKGIVASKDYSWTVVGLAGFFNCLYLMRLLTAVMS